MYQNFQVKATKLTTFCNFALKCHQESKMFPSIRLQYCDFKHINFDSGPVVESATKPRTSEKSFLPYDSSRVGKKQKQLLNFKLKYFSNYFLN